RQSPDVRATSVSSRAVQFVPESVVPQIAPVQPFWPWVSGGMMLQLPPFTWQQFTPQPIEGMASTQQPRTSRAQFRDVTRRIARFLLLRNDGPGARSRDGREAGGPLALADDQGGAGAGATPQLLPWSRGRNRKTYQSLSVASV